MFLVRGNLLRCRCDVGNSKLPKRKWLSPDFYIILKVKFEKVFDKAQLFTSSKLEVQKCIKEMIKIV